MKIGVTGLFILILLIGTVSAELEIFGDDNEEILDIGNVASAITSFLSLSDTPSSYSGQGGNCVVVAAGEDGLEFVACPGGGGGSGSSKWVDVGSFIIPNSTFADNIRVGIIQATDWTNVTDIIYSALDGNATALRTDIVSNWTDLETRKLNLTGGTMSGNLNMGYNNITEIMALQFNATGCTEDSAEGTVCWNADKQTLNIVTGLGNVIQVGQEMTSTVKNIEGSTIYGGQIVYTAGSQGEISTVKLADASNGSKIHSLGMVTVPSCNNNAACQVTYIGLVRDLDTSGYTEGDKLYLQPDGSGNFTSIAPAFPNYTIHIGEVTRVHATTGIVIFVPEVDFGDGVVVNSLGIITNLTLTDHLLFTNGANLYNPATKGLWTESDFHTDGSIEAVGNITLEGRIRNATDDYSLQDFLNDNDTIYTNGSGLYLVGEQFNHSDTSSQASSNNSGNTFIQDIFLDTFGHLTSIVTNVINFTTVHDSIEANISLLNETYLNLSGTNANQDLNLTPYNVELQNVTVVGSVLQNGYEIKSKPSNKFIDGESFAIYANATTTNDVPFVGFQPGGAGQGSWVAGSLMLVNRNETLLNNVNASSCSAWFDQEGVVQQIDCNSSSPDNPLGTGPDLVLFGDQQTSGEVWVRDTDGEWHFITREMELLDELRDNTLLSQVNTSLVGTTFVINESEGDTLVVNRNENNTILTITGDSIALTTGTNTTPQFNHVYYNGGGTPTLTKATTEQDDVADVAQILIGNDYDYGSIAGSATSSEFVRGVYRRFFDDGTVYKSGFTPGAGASEINISSGTMKVLLSNVITTLNYSTDDIAIETHSDGTFHQHLNNLSGFDAYGDGSAIGNNKYFNLICGIAITQDLEGRMYCMVQDSPASEYTNLASAEVDADNTLNFFPNNDFLKKIYIPVIRVVVQRTSNVNTVQLLSNGQYFFDVRGTVSSGGAAPTPSITSHSDLDNLEWNVAGHLFAEANQIMNIGSYNLTTTGWISGSIDWSNLQNIPNIIYDIWSSNNVDGILISNGTAIGINQTAFNESVIQVGLDSGFNLTDGTGSWFNNSFETNTTLNANIGGNLTSMDFIAYGDGLVVDADSPTIGALDTTNFVGALIQANDEDGRMGTNTNHPLMIVTNSIIAATVDTSQNWNFTSNVTVLDRNCYDSTCTSFDNETGRYFSSGTVGIIWNGTALIGVG